MAFQPIPPPGDDAFKDGALNKAYLGSIVKAANRGFEFSMPPGVQKPGVLVGDDKVIFDFTKVQFQTLNALPHPLRIYLANAVGVPKVRILTGYMNLIKADSTMTADEATPFILTLASTAGLKYIYADVTVAYNTTEGYWEATASSVTSGTSLPSATATHMFIQIGRVMVYAIVGGFSSYIIGQDVSGNQWVDRHGGDSTYTDKHGLR